MINRFIAFARRMFRRWRRPPERPSTIWERGRDTSFFFGTPGFSDRQKRDDG